MVQDEAEDAGLLAQVKDDNDVMRQPQRRTCLDICLDCYMANFTSFCRNAQCAFPTNGITKSVFIHTLFTHAVALQNQLTEVFYHETVIRPSTQ